MSIDPDDLEGEEEPGEESEESDAPADRLRGLRRKAKDADRLAGELATVKRELEFSRALGPSFADDPRLKYFVKGYEGDLDAAAIKTAATEAGFLATPSSESPQPDMSAHQRVAQASAGAGNPAPVDIEAEMRGVDWRDPDAVNKILTLAEQAGRVTSRNVQ